MSPQRYRCNVCIAISRLASNKGLMSSKNVLRGAPWPRVLLRISINACSSSASVTLVLSRRVCPSNSVIIQSSSSTDVSRSFLRIRPSKNRADRSPAWMSAFWLWANNCDQWPALGCRKSSRRKATNSGGTASNTRARPYAWAARHLRITSWRYPKLAKRSAGSRATKAF